MSTFDMMMDWREGRLTHGEALSVVLRHMAQWQPNVAGTEHYEALCEIASNLVEIETEEAKAWLSHSCD